MGMSTGSVDNSNNPALASSNGYVPFSTPSPSDRDNQSNGGQPLLQAQSGTGKASEILTLKVTDMTC